MSALTDRHRWCITKILETFGSELTSDAAQSFMRQEAVLTKFTGFFKGESSGRLFVFFQEEAVEGEVSTALGLLCMLLFALRLLGVCCAIHVYVRAVDP